MSYCNKITSNEVYEMQKPELEHTLNGCELYCNRYSQCDTVCMMNDRLRELQGDILKCPHCEHYQEFCDCPDLFYPDINNSKDMRNQLKLLEEMQTKGFNVVTCGHCGQVFIHRT